MNRQLSTDQGIVSLDSPLGIRGIVSTFRMQRLRGLGYLWQLHLVLLLSMELLMALTTALLTSLGSKFTLPGISQTPTATFGCQCTFPTGQARHSLLWTKTA
jgi:hypothetical protein